MEKPVTMDGTKQPTDARTGSAFRGKELKGRSRLMCRHCDVRGELYRRIKNGEIGDIITLRAYRMDGPTGSAALARKGDMSELMYQSNASMRSSGQAAGP